MCDFCARTVSNVCVISAQFDGHPERYVMIAQKTTRVTPSVPEDLYVYLVDLTKVPTYGRSPSAVVLNLIQRGIEDAIDKGRIQQRSFD